MRRIGTGYIGTDNIKTSTTNLEVIPTAPREWTTGYSLYKFSFINKQVCTVIVNGQVELFLDVEQGFETSEIDAPINSFVIKEADVQYQFIGCY